MKECMGKEVGRIHIPVGVFMREQFIYIASVMIRARLG